MMLVYVLFVMNLDEILYVVIYDFKLNGLVVVI